MSSWFNKYVDYDFKFKFQTMQTSLKVQLGWNKSLKALKTMVKMLLKRQTKTYWREVL